MHVGPGGFLCLYQNPVGQILTKFCKKNWEHGVQNTHPVKPLYTIPVLGLYGCVCLLDGDASRSHLQIASL